MLRNVNTPDVPVPRIAEDYVIRKTCATCGEPIEYTVPAGTAPGLVRLFESQTPECEGCQRKREDAEDAEQARKMRRRRVEGSGLPRTLRRLEFSDYEVDDPRWPKAAKVREAAIEWVAAARLPMREAVAAGRRRGLLVSGPVGTGKTRLAATATWSLLLSRDVRWVSVPELLIKLGASFSDKDRAQAIKVLTGKGALVLDDLDKIKPSLWVLQNLFTAIDNRYQSGAPLFVTSNLPPAKLVEYFAGQGDDAPERRTAAEAIVSRLMEHCVVGSLTGPDRRRG